jgi:hypothetical protein
MTRHQVKLYDKKRFMFAIKTFNSLSEADEYFINVAPKLDKDGGCATIERVRTQYDKEIRIG